MILLVKVLVNNSYFYFCKLIQIQLLETNWNGHLPPKENYFTAFRPYSPDDDDDVGYGRISWQGKAKNLFFITWEVICSCLADLWV